MSRQGSQPPSFPGQTLSFAAGFQGQTSLTLKSRRIFPQISLRPLQQKTTLSPALSSWQDIVSAIKLKFEEEMLPPSPRKCTCQVRYDSSFHQEE